LGGFVDRPPYATSIVIVTAKTTASKASDRRIRLRIVVSFAVGVSPLRASVLPGIRLDHSAG
jgi:hypothetical protein